MDLSWAELMAATVAKADSNSAKMTSHLLHLVQTADQDIPLRCLLEQIGVSHRQLMAQCADRTLVIAH